MNKDLAMAAGQLLLRVPLKGSEVPAFNAVMQALDDIIKKEDKECPTSTNSLQT